jgi:Flp pilus assembly protein TadG
MSRRHRAQGGQSLVLSALLITALIGLVGLVVDGGEAANEQQIVRSAADGAALAGAYSISKGSTIAAATTLAGQVLVAVPLPAGDLTMTYLDSSGAVTAVAASVTNVRATVVDNHTTYFIEALGVPTLRLTATAEASTGSSSGVSAACAVCVMAGTGTGFREFDNGSDVITGGPLQVNSSSGSALRQGDDASLTAPSISVVGGVTKGNGTITPTPTTGVSAIADPLAAIPVPVVAGAAASFTAPGGTSTLSPGVYSTVTVNTGSTLTLSPGTFVITTQLNVNGGTLMATGVTIFLTCTTYPTACGSGALGGYITVGSGSFTLSPPTSGPYFGLTVFADRNNVSRNTFSSSTATVSGTWYTLAMALADISGDDTLSFGQLVVASISLRDNVVFSAARSATQAYGTGGGGGSTVKLTL